MKKRNLFLSLVCSIILTVALVAVTVASLFAPGKTNTDNGNNGSNITDRPDPEKPYPSNEENDGSEEKPYIIYNAESFLNLLGEFGTEEKYFELDRDIDFAENNFVTLFQDKEFNGHINGNGFELKNISIDVTTSNLNNYIVKDADEKYVSNVAVFGKINNAEISDIVYNNVKVEIANEVYDYIRGGAFVADHEAAFKQLTIGTVAAIANNSTINAEVKATINADAYSVYAENYVQGYNAVGGVVGVANRTTIDNTKTTVEVNVNAGDHYFVGGVAGYAYNSTISNNTVNLYLVSEYDQVLYVGGVAGYVLGSNIEKDVINITANQIGSSFNTNGVKTIEESAFTKIAGIVNVIRADNADQKTTIDTISVTANVNADVIYAGAVYEVRNAEYSAGKITTERYITIKDVIVDSNVNVLKAFGFAKKLVAATVDLNKFALDVANQCAYNIRLTGKVLLNNNDDTTVSSMFVTNIIDLDTGAKYFDVVGGYNTVRVVISNSIYGKVELGEMVRFYTVTVVD